MALRDIPAIGQTVPAEIRDKFERMRELAQTLAGFRGDPLDRALTLRDLNGGTLAGLGSGGTPVPGPPGPPSTVPGPPGPGVPTPDLTPPPTVTGLGITAGFSYVIVEWDAPTYTEGNGHLQTNIYAVQKAADDPTLPTFGDAVKVYSATGSLTIAALPSEMNMRWHVWAKWETVDEIESTSPAGGTNGVSDTTGQDVSQLRAVLAGQLQASELHSSLGTRIDLIDAGSGVAGSVDQRIASSAATLTSAYTGAIATGNATTLASAQTYVQGFTFSQSAITGALTAQFNSLTANYQAADTTTTTNLQAYTQSWAYSRAQADSAVAGSINTLSASIGGAGGNLLPNSSFEVDTNADGMASGWQPYNNTAGLEPHVMSLVAGRLGGLAQRIAWSGTNTSTKGLNTDLGLNEGGVNGGLRNGWQPNRTYVVSWYCKSASGSAGIPMGLAWNIAPVTTVALLNPPLSSSAWQRYAFRITWGASVEGGGRIYATIGGAGSGFMDFDDFMAQEGDLLTGYVQGDQPQLSAAVQQETITRASQTGALFAQWTVKVDINGYVSGFGLASTANNATPTSAFIVRADSFAISSPSGPGITPIVPFIVRTTPTTVNGVAVPVGVYMDGAFMQNGSITNLKVGNAAIDDAKIANLSASKINAGSMSAAFITTGTITADRMIAGLFQGDNVLTRGLTVRDNAGTVVLSSGTQNRNDTATTLNLNPTFSAWSGTYPDGWGLWTGSVPTRETSNVTGGSPYAVRYSVVGDSGANISVIFSTPLAAGTFFTGSIQINVVTDAGGGYPGYLMRIYTNAALTTFVDNIIVPPSKTAGWQKVPFTAASGGSLVYGFTLYQMAAWNGLPGGLTADGSVVLFGPIELDVRQPITATNASTYIANAAIQDAQIGNLHASKITVGLLQASQIQSPVAFVDGGGGLTWTASGGADGRWTLGNPYVGTSSTALARSTNSSVIYARSTINIRLTTNFGFWGSGSAMVPRFTIQLQLINAGTGAVAATGHLREWGATTLFYGSDDLKWTFEVNEEFSGALSGAVAYYLRATLYASVYHHPLNGGAIFSNPLAYSGSTVNMVLAMSESNA